MRIELRCAACGRNNFSLDQELSDGSLIICQDCGHEIGTLARLKELVAEEVLKRSGRETAGR
jgi:DNA-directed RNA polymerase subunit RPC12/RpoP